MSTARRSPALLLVHFTASCGPGTGSLEVDISTTGETLDQDGYNVRLGTGDSLSLNPNGTATFGSVAAGSHELELTGIQVNARP